MSKPKPLPNPSRPSPRLTRHAFSYSSFFFSADQLVTPDIPRFVSRGLSHPAMFSSIPFLFVYPYMPIFMFFSLYGMRVMCACLSSFFIHSPEFFFLPLPPTVLILRASTKLGRVGPGLGY